MSLFFIILFLLYIIPEILLAKRLAKNKKLRKSIQKEESLFFPYFFFQIMAPEFEFTVVNFYDFKGIERKMIKLLFYVPAVTIFLSFFMDFIYYNFCY